jgi:hypothetical protein
VAWLDWKYGWAEAIKHGLNMTTPPLPSHSFFFAFGFLFFSLVCSSRGRG